MSSATRTHPALTSPPLTGSATVGAMAIIEDDLDASLMDDAFWVSLWQDRGVTRLAKLVWALLNQGRLADGDEPIWSERAVQARINAANLHSYLLAALRAYGQEDFADALEAGRDYMRRHRNALRELAR